MYSSESSIFRVILNKPVVVIIVALIISFTSAYAIQFLVFKGDYQVFFSDDNPQLLAYEKMQQVFSKNDNVMFVLSPKKGDIFTPKVLQAIEDLTLASWQIPYSLRVDSISNFQYTHANEDELIVEELYENALGLTQDSIDSIKKIVFSEPLIVNRLVSDSAKVAAVNVTLQLPESGSPTIIKSTVARVREIRHEILTKYPDIQIHISGLLMLNNAFGEASQHDIKTLIPIMLLVVIFVIAIMMRSFVGAFATTAVIILSVLTSIGLFAWTGKYMTGPVASAPIVILTLAVADCIHLLASYYHELRRGLSQYNALLSSLRINVKPIILTSVTTAIGFLCMNFSDVPPFRDLGNLVAAGVIIAMLFSMTVLPAIIMILPVTEVKKSTMKYDFLSKIAEFVIRYKYILLTVNILLVAIFSSFIGHNELNDNYIKYFDKSLEFRKDADYIQQHLSGMSIAEISVDTGIEGGVQSPENMRMIDSFVQWLRVQPETDHVNTLTDTIKRLNMNMHNDDLTFYRLPESRELAAQYLLLYELSLPYGLDINNQINIDRSMVRILLTMKNATSNEKIAFENRIMEWAENNTQPLLVSVTGSSQMFAYIGQRNIQGMLIGSAVALLLISILLIFALQSFKIGLLSLVPNLLPAAVGFGVWGLLVGQIGIGLSAVASLTLGIIVDDTVHFLTKYLHARRDKKLMTEDAIRYAFSSVGQALWTTTLVLFSGFMILAQSSFKVNAEMGLLTAFTIAVALFIDFFLLPPLLLIFDSNNE